jgi:exonuclease SbcD
LKIAHLADLHFGFRRYDYHTKDGMNQREADVIATHRTVARSVMQAQPDLIVIAGDVFHTIRPPNGSLLSAYGFVQYLAGLGKPICIIAGDHDTPRIRESAVLGLLRTIPGVTVAIDTPLRVQHPGLPDIYLVPDLAVRFKTVFDRPTPRSESILVAHGELSGPEPWLLPELYEDWMYAALGHQHTALQVTATARYAGSTDYTSTDPWTESRTQPPKGWTLWEDGVATHVESHPRAHVDFTPWDDAEAPYAKALDHLVGELDYAPAGAVCRWVVHCPTRQWKRDFPRKEALDIGRAHELLHLQLDLRVRGQRMIEGEVVSTPAVRRPNLREIVERVLRGATLSEGLDREEFVREGLRAYDDTAKPEESSREQSDVQQG